MGSNQGQGTHWGRQGNPNTNAGSLSELLAWGNSTSHHSQSFDLVHATDISVNASAAPCSMMFWHSFRKGHEAQGLRSLRRCASDANFLIETSLHINNDGRFLSFSENQFFAKTHRPPLSTDFLPPLRTLSQDEKPREGALQRESQ